MTLKEFFSLKKNSYFWLNILAMILFVIIAFNLTFKGLDIYTQHWKGVSVPNVKGMQLYEADMLLREQNLDIVAIDSAYFPSYPAGAIVEQNPAVGSWVKADRLIFVTINSNNPPKRTIPDVIDNCSLREAQAKMGSAGFRLTEHEYMQGEKDWVYGVKYEGRELASGEKVPVGSTLTLLVGDNEYLLKMERDSLLHSMDSIPQEEPKTAIDDSWF